MPLAHAFTWVLTISLSRAKALDKHLKGLVKSGLLGGSIAWIAIHEGVTVTRYAS